MTLAPVHKLRCYLIVSVFFFFPTLNFRRQWYTHLKMNSSISFKQPTKMNDAFIAPSVNTSSIHTGDTVLLHSHRSKTASIGTVEDLLINDVSWPPNKNDDNDDYKSSLPSPANNSSIKPSAFTSQYSKDDIITKDFIEREQHVINIGKN